MGGYIRIDKDLEDDPRILALASAFVAIIAQTLKLAEVSDQQERFLGELARNSVLGGVTALWRYADTHIRRDNTLRVTLGARDNVVTAALRELSRVTRLPVTLLELFPSEWLHVRDDGMIELPDYIDKNSLDDKEKRKAKNRDRQRRWRERHNATRNALQGVINNGRNAPSRGRARARVPLPLPLPLPNPTCVEGARDAGGEGFARIRSAYPKFSGRQDWLAAEHHCLVRIGDDHLTWDELEAAAGRYARYCAAGGVSGPQYVLTPAKFFSAADRPWEQPWDPPPTKADQRLAGNVSAVEEFMRRTEPAS